MSIEIKNVAKTVDFQKKDALQLNILKRKQEIFREIKLWIHRFGIRENISLTKQVKRTMENKQKVNNSQRDFLFCKCA